MIKFLDPEPRPLYMNNRDIPFVRLYSHEIVIARAIADDLSFCTIQHSGVHVLWN